MLIIMDLDSMLYKIGFVNQQVNEAGDIELKASEETQCEQLGNTIKYILMDLYDGTEQEVRIYLSNNLPTFRHKLATIRPYKGTRKREKPLSYDALVKYLINEWGATIVAEGIEPDDQCCIDWYDYNSSLGGDSRRLHENAVIVHIDKDLDQIPGMHYNFTKYEMYEVTPQEAQLNLYTQVICGDSSDNIQGIAGAGPAKARQVLADTSTNMYHTNIWSLWHKTLVNQCKKEGIDHKTGGLDLKVDQYMEETLRLLMLLRSEDEKQQVLTCYEFI